MSMTQDIGGILESWEYDPERNYRRIVGDDGREKVQIRVDNAAFQGVLQMDLDGRPDGRKPFGFDFALDYYRQAQRRYCTAHGSDRGFSLDPDACAQLFDESLRVYNRYVFLLQLQDFSRVIRDTERNMQLFRFVHSYAAREADRNNLERWWPYILRVHGTARAMQAMEGDGDHEQALRIIIETRRKIDDLEPLDIEEFHVERERSLKALRELEESILARRPATEKDRLEKELTRAVAEERFEEAARLRDHLRSLED